MNFKKIFAFLMTFVLAFSLIACNQGEDGKEEVSTEEKLEQVIAGVIVDSSFKLLQNDLILPSEVNGEYLITWTIDEKYSAHARIEETADGKQKIAITRPNADADFYEFEFVATIADKGVSVSRTWKGWVKPKDVTSEMTCAQFLAAPSQAKGTISGVVTFAVPNKGYWVKDDTASVYVYAAGEYEVKVGDKVTVSGTKDIYYSLVELVSPSVDELTAGNGAFDYEANAVESNVAAIREIVANAKDEDGQYKFETISSYGKFYKIGGVVLANTDSSISYKWVISDYTTGEIFNLYDSSMEAGTLEKLAELEGKYVEAVFMLWDIHSNGYGRLVPVLSTLKEAAAPTVADDVKVANTKAELQALLEGKTIVSDVELATTGKYDGLSIAWTSSNEAVLSAAGKLGTSTNPVEKVTLTAVIKAGEVEETLTMEVTVAFLEATTIDKVITACDGDSVHVMFNAKIIALDEDGYFYAADNTGVIYVRTKLTNGLAVGDSVQIVGTTSVYNNKGKQYTRQIAAISMSKLDAEVKTIAAEKATIEDFAACEAAEGVLTDAGIAAVKAHKFNGKLVTITGYVTIRGQYSNVYIATENDTESAAVLVYYKSSSQEEIKSYEGKLVTITCTVYDCHASDGWRLGSVVAIAEGTGEVEYNVITLAQAIEIASPLTENTEEKYVVYGIVKAYYGKEASAKQWGNLVLTDGVNDLTIYGTYDATGEVRYDAMGEKAPQIGEMVALYGVLGAYKGSPQMVNGCVISTRISDLAEISAPLTENTTEEYFLVAEVKAYYGKESSAKQWGNLTVTDGTADFTVYGTYDATGEVRYDAMGEAAPQVGDIVLFKGVLGAYKGVGQMVNGKVLGKFVAPQETE